MMVPCLFAGCTLAAVDGSIKCTLHKSRQVCRVPSCCNIVYARGKCVRHGGRKQCRHVACTASAHRGDFCANHGGIKRLCSVDGCTTQAHARRLCVRHGGGRQCRADACVRHAKVAGYCSHHKPAPTEMPWTSPAEIDVCWSALASEGIDDDWSAVDALILDAMLQSI
ncbi:Aste57867_21756 [Aphanomyces stellatus]|uniref:Aste57867_21756 protein n=1 Tax=Aphanomyces stellatus TaxID=120398 RepID=A0A485LID5_9STRA|nr:hypothetical protein As57867_021687 [Aphanomyces stellatus]VFT98425.1 Aste57867_21756 [Aphanomyces stellatus]